jgi:hypothetical protein
MDPDTSLMSPSQVQAVSAHFDAIRAAIIFSSSSIAISTPLSAARSATNLERLRPCRAATDSSTTKDNREPGGTIP